MHAGFAAHFLTPGPCCTARHSCVRFKIQIIDGSGVDRLMYAVPDSSTTACERLMRALHSMHQPVCLMHTVPTAQWATFKVFFF